MAQRRNQRRPVTLATLAGFLSLVQPVLLLGRGYIATGSWRPALYICAISGLTFGFYGYDKMQALNRGWRVKELTLHALAILGGWPGALLGQHFFQHKTTKVAFQIPSWMIIFGYQIFCWSALRS